MTRPRIGLALGSGAGRGWAHIGVIRALMAEGIRPDIVAGTSIGALVGGVWLAGHLDVLEDWARGLNRMRILRYLDLSLSAGGLIGGRRLTRLLNDNLGDMRVEDLDVPFAAVATELETGHEIWLRRGTLVDALRASYALPGVFTPHEIDNQALVDGALVNPVPVSVCRAFGARLVIAVNLNADMFGSRRTPSSAQAGAAADGNGSNGGNGGNLLSQLFGQAEGAPGLFNVMVASLGILQDRISRSRLAGDPPDVTIAPKVGHIGLLEFDQAPDAIAAGEEAVRQTMPTLRAALAVLGEHAPPRGDQGTP